MHNHPLAPLPTTVCTENRPCSAVLVYIQIRNRPQEPPPATVCTENRPCRALSVYIQNCMTPSDPRVGGLEGFEHETGRFSFGWFEHEMGCFGARVTGFGRFEHKTGPSGARVPGFGRFEHETGPFGTRVRLQVHPWQGEVHQCQGAGAYQSLLFPDMYNLADVHVVNPQAAFFVPCALLFRHE